MKKEKTIYDLELHEDILIHNLLNVVRVPGGWMYENIRDERLSSVFVPFNNEFQKI